MEIFFESPPRLCIAAFSALKPLVDRMWEAFLNNKVEVMHDTTHCPDVGIGSGGVGSVVMRVHAEAIKRSTDLGRIE